MNARYYDPEIARFISPDPIHFTEQNPFSFNRYLYANNNPLKFVDPDGRETLYIFNGPTFFRGGDNPFGHSAIAFTGSGLFSYGNSKVPGSSVTNYLLRESTKRDSTLVILPTTKAQEDAMLGYFRQFPDPNEGMGLVNNCAMRTANALMTGGILNDYFPERMEAYFLPHDQLAAVRRLPGSNVVKLKQNGPIPSFLTRFNPEN